MIITVIDNEVIYNFDNESTFRYRIKEVMKKKHENNIISKLLKFLHNHSDRSYCMPD